MADVELNLLEKQLQDVEAQLEDLKARWPAHSLKPAMLSQLEELEDERDRLKRLVEEGKS
ncbi:MAG: histidine kinase [Desulfitobacteriaceae bacterium]